MRGLCCLLLGLLAMSAGCVSKSETRDGALAPVASWSRGAQFDLGPDETLVLRVADIRRHGMPLGPYARPTDEVGIVTRTFAMPGTFEVSSRSQTWSARHGSKATFCGHLTGAQWSGPVAVLVFEDAPDDSHAVLIKLREPADGSHPFTGLSTGRFRDRVEIRFHGS